MGATKTASSVRTVPLGAGLLAMLEQERTRQEQALRTMAGLGEGVTPVRPLIEPDMCVFCADIGTPAGRLAPRSLGAMRAKFKASVRKAGLPSGTVPHSLRHSGITAMLAGDAKRPGVSVADAAAIAGHSSPVTTAGTYAHAVQANMRRGADLADSLVSPAPAATAEQLANRKGGEVTG